MADTKRIYIYLSFAFGIAWLAGLAIYLTGGLAKSPYSIVLLSVGYMGAPAFAHILTRLITKEGWRDVYLRPRFKKGWVYWLICWIAPAIFTFTGMAIFFALFPGYYDPTLAAVQKIIQATLPAGGQSSVTIDPWLIVISQTATAILIAPILNVIPILGEEFGWRAYLQPKLLPLGSCKAMVLMGIIWGLWHAPIIAMGHNFGVDYPGAPWLGILAMTWFTFLFGTFIGWAVLRSGSVWPAVIGHGALNGIAGIQVFFIQGHPNQVLGPAVVGLIGSLGIAIITLTIFLWPGALTLESRSATALHTA